LSDAQQEIEQEALRFVPEEWGMQRSSENSDFLFLNMGPNHPSVHGVFRVALQLDGEVKGYDYKLPFDPFIVTVGVGYRF
jgi:NADH-quinone oxidoreductase subunit C/D